MDNYNHEEHVHQEMDMLITYNWALLKSKPYTNCTNSTDLAQRLWTTFQINGYLPTEMKFPKNKYPKGLNSSQFANLAHESYRNRPSKSSKEWRLQREKAMTDAYKLVPTDIMYKLKDLYSEDFQMFGYDPEPDLLFAHRRTENEKKHKSNKDSAR